MGGEGRAGRAGVHALTVIENVTVTLSHIAKGPEIEPRHRLVPAVGTMRLVAGQARLLRQVELCLHRWH